MMMKLLKKRPHVRQGMEFAVADRGDRGEDHVEAIEPRPAFEVMKSGDADQDQSDQGQEDDP